MFFLSLNEYGEKIADTIPLGPVKITKYYNFYKKQTSPNAFIADGVGMTINGVPLPSYYSDKDEIYKFPLSYGNHDSTTFRFAAISTSAIPVSYSKTGYWVTDVDGWGTVTTPYGTENCLRVVTTQYSTDTIKFSGFPFGVPNIQRSYQWLTLNSKIPYLEITGSVTGNIFTITQAKYRGYEKPKNLVDVPALTNDNFPTLFPNPVNQQLFIKSHAGEYSYSISDLKGNCISSAKLSAAENCEFIDVNTLTGGIYILKISSEEEVRFLKFVKL